MITWLQPRDFNCWGWKSWFPKMTKTLLVITTLNPFLVSEFSVFWKNKMPKTLRCAVTKQKQEKWKRYLWWSGRYSSSWAWDKTSRWPQTNRARQREHLFELLACSILLVLNGLYFYYIILARVKNLKTLPRLGRFVSSPTQDHSDPHCHTKLPTRLNVHACITT